jgi:hypothetical protein
MRAQSNQFLHTKPLQRCVNFLRSYLPSRWLQEWCTISLQTLVRLVIPAGLDVSVNEIIANKRILTGFMLMVVGCCSVVFHYLFDESVRNLNWFYVNWYYFFYTIRFYIVVIFWSAAFYCFTPIRYKLRDIPFTIAQAFGWWNVIHYSFFVTSNKEFHAFPEWSVIVLGFSLGFSFIVSTEELVYLWEHRRKGILCRFVGLTDIDHPIEKKDQLYKNLSREYKNINY